MTEKWYSTLTLHPTKEIKFHKTRSFSLLHDKDVGCFGIDIPPARPMVIFGNHRKCTL